jgi:hypothetical protein
MMKHSRRHLRSATHTRTRGRLRGPSLHGVGLAVVECDLHLARLIASGVATFGTWGKPVVQSSLIGFERKADATSPLLVTVSVQETTRHDKPQKHFEEC